MITSISVSALNPPFVESDLMLPYSGAEDDSRPSSKKFLFAFDSFARFRHQFRPRFGFSEARVAAGKTRLPQLVHALQQSFHNRRAGRLSAPEEHRPHHQRNKREFASVRRPVFDRQLAADFLLLLIAILLLLLYFLKKRRQPAQNQD